MRWGMVLLVLSCAAPLACGGASAGDDAATADSAYAKTDFREDDVLPYTGAWLDPPRALAGIGQFDRLKSTVHDGAKCSTMVALAASIVGGHDRFLALVSEIERLRASYASDLAITAAVRTADAALALTPRLLHQFTEAVVRAYKVESGATDAQIAKMIRASGWLPVPAGSKRPPILVAALGPGEIVPVSTVVDNEAHVILIWKDASSVVRLYDSDDIHGPHVLAQGSALYDARVDDPLSAWDRRETFKLP